MTHAQSAILLPTPSAAHFLSLGLEPNAEPRAVLDALARMRVDDGIVIGLGEPLTRAFGHEVPGLRSFPQLAGPGVAFPSTQAALWLYLRGDDAGALVLRARELLRPFEDTLRIDEAVSAFRYDTGRDLSGYEYGTENPVGAAAQEAAFVADGRGMQGASFVATQRWVHELARFEALTPRERDHVVGRELVSNEELADAPASAHVKRAAQESFVPPAFMIRRSMPWGDVRAHGLYFVAFAASLDAYERVLTRMAGLEDGVPDALLRFSRAVSGGYYFCPPVREGHLALDAVGRR